MNIDRQTILKQVTDEELHIQFSSYLDRSDNIDFSTFAEEVDQSDYSLIDWVDAIVGFDQWLTKAQPHYESRDFSHMVGYLHCCQMTLSDNLAKPKMRDAVDRCLEDFGYEPSHLSQN